jgi:predicted  nucleic acid-binding Zn-ribbon protein
MAKIIKKTVQKTKPVKLAKATPKAKPQKKGIAKPIINKGKPSPKKIKPVAKKSLPKKVVAKKIVAKKSVPIKKIASSKIVAANKNQKKTDTKKAVVKKPIAKKVVNVEKNKKPSTKVEIKKPIVKILSKIVEKKKNIMVKKEDDVVKKVSDVKKKNEVAKAKENLLKVEKTEKVLTTGKADDKGDTAIEKKLKALINLQQIDSQIDKIRIIRGELPLEVQDLEDEIAGIQTRIENYSNEVNALDEAIAERKNAIKQCQVLIKKYETQQSNVRNNREYDSLSKEMEFQNLEIQLCEKRIKEYKVTLETKKEIIENSQKQLDEKLHDAKIKRDELNDIVEETEKEESNLLSKSLGNQKIIEERLLTAYKKIRKNARNGLAVVVVERDACGGCFNKIPPQRQLDIRIHKKIIVCEYCGRILVDPEIMLP